MRKIEGAWIYCLAFVLATALYSGCSSSGVHTRSNTPGTGSDAIHPCGIFTASGVSQTSANPLEDVNVNGGLIRINWAAIETSSDHTNGTGWNWSQLDRQIDSAECNANCYTGETGGICTNQLRSPCTPKNWSLAIIGGPTSASNFSPPWLTSELNVSTLELTFQSKTGPAAEAIPKFWDPTLQSRLQSFINAVAARYAGDSYLKLVYVTQMTQNGIEGHFNGVADADLEAAGYTVDDFVSGVEQAAVSFGAAFPGISIAIELHYQLSSSCEGLRVMYDIANNSGEFANLSEPAVKHYGVAAWWYGGGADPKTSSFNQYQGDLLFGRAFGDAADHIGTSGQDTYGLECSGRNTMNGGFTGFVQSSGRVYAQVIQQSNDPGDGCGTDGHTACNNFPYTYAEIFDQAITIGFYYIEVWQQDIGTTWESNLASFNSSVCGK